MMHQCPQGGLPNRPVRSLQNPGNPGPVPGVHGKAHKLPAQLL